MENTVKENKDNDAKFREGLLKDHPQPAGQVFGSIQEAAASIKKEDIEYITD